MQARRRHPNRITILEIQPRKDTLAPKSKNPIIKSNIDLILSQIKFLFINYYLKTQLLKIEFLFLYQYSSQTHKNHTENNLKKLVKMPLRIFIRIVV